MSDDQDIMREQLKTIPYKLLAAELARRNAEKRRIYSGGDRSVMLPCPKCGVVMNARRRRKACPKH